MVKQLGCRTFFLTLYCADLKRNEHVEIISKLNSPGLNYFETCKILNSNVMLLIRHSAISFSFLQ